MSGGNQAEPNCGIKSVNNLDKRRKHIKKENALVTSQVAITLYNFTRAGNTRY